MTVCGFRGSCMLGTVTFTEMWWLKLELTDLEIGQMDICSLSKIIVTHRHKSGIFSFQKMLNYSFKWKIHLVSVVDILNNLSIKTTFLAVPGHYVSITEHLCRWRSSLCSVVAARVYLWAPLPALNKQQMKREREQQVDNRLHVCESNALNYL